MIILDTDHVTILGFRDNPRCTSLRDRLDTASEPNAIPIIAWEEQVKGWLAEIKRAKSFQDQVVPYDKLFGLVEFFSEWEILPFTEAAANECERLRKERIRIGSQDLKIAAITLTNDALLLSANLKDFGKVPGLRVENWLD